MIVSTPLIKTHSSWILKEYDSCMRRGERRTGPKRDCNITFLKYKYILEVQKVCTLILHGFTITGYLVRK